jgi:hypothetical protein
VASSAVGGDEIRLDPQCQDDDDPAANEESQEHGGQLCLVRIHMSRVYKDVVRIDSLTFVLLLVSRLLVQRLLHPRRASWGPFLPPSDEHCQVQLAPTNYSSQSA